ncbi:unnamed protein product, partial [Brenthis ino]
MTSPRPVLLMPPGRNKLKHTIKNKRIHFQYTEEALAQAVQAIRTENKSVREACRHYGVPRSTVQNRISGRSKEHPRKVGPEPILGIDREQKVVDWITELAKCGIPVKEKRKRGGNDNEGYSLLTNSSIPDIGSYVSLSDISVLKITDIDFEDLNTIQIIHHVCKGDKEHYLAQESLPIQNNNVEFTSKVIAVAEDHNNPSSPKKSIHQKCNDVNAKESDSDIINTDKDIEIIIKKTKVIEKTDKLNIIKKVDIKEINKISEDKIDKEMSHKSETAIDVTKTIPSDETFKRYDIYEEDEDDHEFDIF